MMSTRATASMGALVVALTAAEMCSAQLSSGTGTGRKHATKPSVTALAFAPDGKTLFIGSQAGLEVRSWPALKATRTLTTELTHIHDLAIAPDGKLLAASGGEPAERGAVELYRLPSIEFAYRRASHKDVIYAVAWRGDAAEFATAGADATVVVHAAATGDVARKFAGHSRAVVTACFLDSGRLITGGADETLRLWDGKGGAVRTFTNHTKTVNHLALRPTSATQSQPMLASASDDRTVRFWQPEIGRLVRFVRLESIPHAIAWTPDGATVVAACGDGRLRVIDAETAGQRESRDAIDGVAYSIAIAPDGSVAVGGTNGQIRRVTLTDSR